VNSFIFCPKCESQNVYSDRSGCECLQCGFMWTPPPSDSPVSYPSHREWNDSLFESLSKLEKPFFKLRRGKLYDCIVAIEGTEEKTSIVPLAFKKGANVQFVMLDARRLFRDNPKFVHDIIKMSYDTIRCDGIKGSYPFDYDALTITCATQQDGTLVDYSDAEYFDFKETGEI
jgi:hypothetical protein